MPRRTKLNTTTRKRVLERDNEKCRKCGHIEGLQVHHIIAVDGGGTDEAGNLITLCRGCHVEYEMFGLPKEMSFEEWLNFPSAISLRRVFAAKELWKEDMSAKNARNGIITAFQTMKPIELGNQQR